MNLFKKPCRNQIDCHFLLYLEHDFRLFARESCRMLSMTPNQSSFCPINMHISMRLVTRLASRVIARVLLPYSLFSRRGSQIFPFDGKQFSFLIVELCPLHATLKSVFSKATQLNTSILT